MRTPFKVLGVAALAVLLAAPTVLAFFWGGAVVNPTPQEPYAELPRLWGAIAACALLIAAALSSPLPLPRSWPGRATLGGLVLLAALVGASIAWAPLKGSALTDFERLLMYAAIAVAAAALLARRQFARAVEPALAGGITVVIGYALSNRLLPGVVEQAHSVRAGGRLEQPLTYWNAMGALAAVGLVLCVRLAGDARRPLAMRAAAIAATAPLGVGVWLSYSRGAFAAVAAGVIVLALLAATRPQWRAIAIAVPAAVIPSLVAEVLHGVRSLEGSLGSRERQGVAMLVVLVATMAVAALVQALLARRERAGRLRSDDPSTPRRPMRLAALAVVLVVMAGTAAVAAASNDAGAPPAFGATSQRFRTFESPRGEYWKVAIGVFGDHPIAGGGSGSFLSYWNERRTIADGAKDAHSLYVETAAELGLAGLLALALFLGGALACAARVLRRDAALAAGPVAAVSVWLVHAGLDWDWEMPALSLVPLILIASLVAAADDPGAVSEPPPARAADPPAPAPPTAPAGAPAAG